MCRHAGCCGSEWDMSRCLVSRAGVLRELVDVAVGRQSCLLNT